MPIYMDIHIVPGVKSKDVAEAHRLDLLHQDEYNCKCMTYWIDEERENIFCLIEAPSKEAVEEMHNNTHGLAPNKIVEVSTTLVTSFLGRIYDPPDAKTTDDGLKVFSDSAFRILVVTKTTDPVLLQHKFGPEKTNGLLAAHNKVIRDTISKYEGREVEHGGHGFIISFTSASKAVSCAMAIHKELPDKDALGFAIGINGGEPIANSNKLYGDAIQLAGSMCSIARPSQISVASAVKELVAKDFQTGSKTFLSLPPQDERLLEMLFNKLEEKWQDPDFDMDEYCHSMTMSKSQLYRKTVSLTGLSPNALLKEFRLEKAKELLKEKRYSISQITFDCGFTSPSYFTKCFKKKYGLLPMTYLELVN